MTKALLKGLLKLIVSLLSLIMTPINDLLMSAIPQLGEVVSSINSLLSYILTIIGYCIDCTGLSSLALSFIVITIIGTTTLYITSYIGKLIVKWYRALMP